MQLYTNVESERFSWTHPLNVDVFHINILWEYFGREISVCFGIHGCEESDKVGS